MISTMIVLVTETGPIARVSFQLDLVTNRRSAGSSSQDNTVVVAWLAVARLITDMDSIDRHGPFQKHIYSSSNSEVQFLHSALLVFISCPLYSQTTM